MGRVNKFGLSRDDLHEDVKRAVRQRCGFGCVVCGAAIYQYEHFDPPFAEAKTHDADGITLLCGGCHDKKTRGYLAASTITQKNKQPKALEHGFSREAFDVGQNHPVIHVGPVTARNVGTVIGAMGDPILAIKPPEAQGAPFRLSATLANKAGTEVMRIQDNEWMASTGNWDVKVTGTRIKINNGPGDIALVLKAMPPDGIAVERLNMYHKGSLIAASDTHGLTVVSPTGVTFTTTGTEVDGSQTAIRVTEAGISVGAGGGSVWIKQASGGQGAPPMPAAPYQPSSNNQPYVRQSPKVGRNEPCPCDSGLKFKRCCGALS